jgi:hypothetical protein
MMPVCTDARFEKPEMVAKITRKLPPRPTAEGRHEHHSIFCAGRADCSRSSSAGSLAGGRICKSALLSRVTWLQWVEGHRAFASAERSVDYVADVLDMLKVVASIGV